MLKYKTGGLISGIAALMPALYQRDERWAIAGRSVAADRITLLSPKNMVTVIGSAALQVTANIPLVLGVAASWDSIAADYTVAANRAGKDFYVYAHAGGVVLSANPTAPVGFTTANSRKIGGFHCLCLSAGTISGHPLTGFLTGDILPESVWDLNHCPDSLSPAGMVYSSKAQLWVDIYLQSGIGVTTGSVFGGTITDSRTWLDFVDDLGAVGKRLLFDPEFQLIADGSNEKTNIAGSADPVTTGGHVDTAGRRMVSGIGCEDCCGVMWQWLLDNGYRYDGGAHTHDVTVSGEAQTVTSTSVAPAPTWAYYALPGNKGSLYRQGDYGDIKLCAGAAWNHGTTSGSRARHAFYYRWYAATNIGARSCARNKGVDHAIT